MMQLKSVVDTYFKGVVIDKVWVSNFNEWYHGLTTKNENHVNFFSSLLLGVYDIKFEVGDFNYIWDVLLEADRDDVERAILNCKVINPKWEVVSNPDNHAFIIMMHLVETSKLSSNEKRVINLKLLIIFQFKFITSRHFNDWKYLANKEIALATYASLSNQFKLKQYASWNEYLRARAMETYLGGELRKDFITIVTKFDDDLALIRTISGVSTNLGKIINRWNKVYYSMHESGTRLSLTTNLGNDGEGGTLFKDLDSIVKYRLYAESNLGNTGNLINNDLVDAIIKTSRLKRKDFIAILTHISAKYELNNDVGKFALGAISYGLNRLVDERKNLQDIGGAYKYLANAYGNNRSTSPTLDNIRIRGNDLIKAAKISNPKSNTVTVICTYLVIWALIH